MSETDWQSIKEDYARGMSLRALAVKYGIGKSAIGERKHKEQWDQAKRTTKRTTDIRADSVHVPVSENPTIEKDLSPKDRQRLFLEAYATHANVMVSARAAGIHRSTVYDWLEKDEDFSFAYHLAKEDARDVLRAEIFRRAHEGWDEEVYQLGNFAGTVHKYSDTLLIFHSKALMPEYRDKQQLDLNTTTTNTNDLKSLHDAISNALADYPEAKWAVAQALAEKGKAS